VLIANPNRAAAKAQSDVTMDNQLGIVRDPATLAQRIQGENWPKKQPEELNGIAAHRE